MSHPCRALALLGAWAVIVSPLVRVAAAQAAPPASARRLGADRTAVSVGTTSPAPRRSVIVATIEGERAAPPEVDGTIGADEWRVATPLNGFVQVQPSQGRGATFDTEVHVAQDDRHLYVAMRARDPQALEAVRVRDLKRDFFWGRSDSMGFILDAVGDRRSIVAFGVSAHGAPWDAQVTDGGLLDNDWDAPWKARTSVDSAGWSAEFAIPWSVIPYARDGGDWRMNFTREVPRLGETTAWSEYPRALGPFRMDFAADVRGMTPPGSPSRLQLRPYAIVARASLGGEATWRPSPQAVIDLSVNTDFAAADVDRQVVNLTRFTPYFPERRPFFLESRGLFTVGAPERILPFFTRSIGLTPSGEPTPIDAGVRGIVRGDGWSGAALVVRQGEQGTTPGATIGVARAQRSLGARARMGALFVERVDHREGADARSTTIALDGFARPTPQITLNGLLSRTAAGASGRDGIAWWGEAVRVTNRIESGVGVEYVGKDYEPSAGFVARGDLIRASARSLLDWRPDWRPRGVRAFRPALIPTASWRASDRAFLESQLTARLLAVDFLNTSKVVVEVVGDWQAVERSFVVVPGVEVRTGSYRAARLMAEYQSSFARPLAVTLGVTTGGFFGGRLTRATSRLAWTPVPRVVLDASHTLAAFSEVGERQGRYVTHLLAPELRLAANPRMQLAVFYQHNTAARQGALNARFVWEYLPLSTLAVVYGARAPLADHTGGVVQAPSRQGELVVKLSWTRLP